MKRNLFVGLLFWIIVSGQAFPQEKLLIKLHYEENNTPTYEEIISMYQVLDRAYENTVLVEASL